MDASNLPTKAVYIHKGTSTKQEIKRGWNVVTALVIRDIQGRYRRSTVGPLWALLQPLFYMIVFTVLRGILNFSSGDMPYVVFTYSALVPFSFFSNGVSLAGNSIAANIAIIKKISIRREIFPAVSILTALVDFFIASVLLFIMVIWYKLPLTWNWLWLLSLIPLLVLLTFGLGLAAAAVIPYKGDLKFAISLFMQVWVLACPIAYPMSMVPEKWRFLYQLNPMVGIIDGFRSIIVQGLPPDPMMVGFSLLGTVLVWLVAWPSFRYLSQFFAEVY